MLRTQSEVGELLALCNYMYVTIYHGSITHTDNLVTVGATLDGG